jgi:hypothetical protein
MESLFAASGLIAASRMTSVFSQGSSSEKPLVILPHVVNLGLKSNIHSVKPMVQCITVDMCTRVYEPVSPSYILPSCQVPYLEHIHPAILSHWVPRHRRLPSTILFHQRTYVAGHGGSALRRLSPSSSQSLHLFRF